MSYSRTAVTRYQL